MLDQPGPGIGLGDSNVSHKTVRIPPPPRPMRLTAKSPKLGAQRPQRSGSTMNANHIVWGSIR
ncbi:hypothetical protein GGQ85_003338 [Nitrobacter vulgaris]|jgi:hypothetical protein|nr:hypothetical protein [Nitrobacter vulgaris]